MFPLIFVLFFVYFNKVGSGISLSASAGLSISAGVGSSSDMDMGSTDTSSSDSSGKYCNQFSGFLKIVSERGNGLELRSPVFIGRQGIHSALGFYWLGPDYRSESW